MPRKKKSSTNSLRLKKLSNPYSTGGIGHHFEAHIQASFVVLMLTGGYVPCFSGFPIVEIKLQGKIDGYETDDVIVYVQKKNSKERRKLLGQIKHRIRFTKSESNTLFAEVMCSAWRDFNNQEVFTKDNDVIALITGSISESDMYTVGWILDQARCTKNKEEFFRNVKRANFSPSKCEEKLKVFQLRLKQANGNKEVSPICQDSCRIV